MDEFVPRHVLELHRTPPLDELGFLRLANGLDLALFGESPATPLEELEGHPSLVLLAPGSAGKTWALNHLASREAGAIEVELRFASTPEAHAILHEAAKSGAIVYVDHLDEAMQSLPQLPRLLESASDAATSETRWRFGCRHAAWTDGLGQALSGAVDEYRLLPLTRKSARRLVDTELDADAFFEALGARRLRFLPSTPSRLKALAARWSEEDDAEFDLADLLANEVEQLLSELDPLRAPPTTSLQRRRALAGRLAAFTLLSGVRGFTARGDQEAQGVLLANLPDDPEPSTPEERVSPAEYRETLASSIFEAFATDLIRFSHEQLAEFLAADYVRSRRPTRAQAQEILRLSDSGILPGRLAGLASWVGALAPSLVEHIIPENPVVFAQSGVELATSELRGMVVRALLDAAARGDLEWTWTVDLSALSYPRLSQDLLAAAEAPWEGFYLPWWVARLAQACGCDDLVPTLLDWTRDVTLADGARCAAIDAVSHLGGAAAKRELLLLVEGDVDDEILGHCLQALFPEVLTSEELVTLLRPMTCEVIGGTYWTFLNEVPARLNQDGLISFLASLADWGLHGKRQQGRVLAAALEAAWAAMVKSGDVLRALAQLIVAIYERDHTLDEDTDDGHPWREGDPHRRRALATEIARLHPESRSAMYVLYDAGLLESDDVAWLMTDLESLEARVRDQLLTCVVPLAARPDPELADMILTLDEDHYAYTATESLRSTCSLETESYRRKQELREREQQRSARQKEAAQRYATDLRQALDEARSDVSNWWRLIALLGEERDRRSAARTGEAQFSNDLTRRSGWKHLNDAEQQQVIELGLAYLEHRNPEPDEWRGRRQYSPSEMQVAYRDWSGAYLLTTLAKHHPNRLAEVPAELLAKWTDALVGAWRFDRDDDTQLPLAVAEALADEKFGRAAIASALLDDIDARCDSSADTHLPAWWQGLVRFASDGIRGRLIDAEQANECHVHLFDLLATGDSDAAHRLAREIADVEGHPLRSRALGLLAGDAEQLRQLLLNQPDAEDMAAICAGLDFASMPTKLVAKTLRRLATAHPLSDDPPLASGWQPNAPESQMRDKRNAAANELAQRGHTDTLEELRNSCTSEERWWWQRHVIQARKAAAELLDERPTPAELMNVLSSADARLVRSAQDVVELATTCLDEIQLEIRNGAWKSLWDLGATPRPKNEDDVTDEVTRLLRPLLHQRGLADREVQVSRPKSRGIGNRADLMISAGRDHHRVVVEAKHVHNQDLLTSLHDQLVERYMRAEDATHGIYLVYWVDRSDRPFAGPSDSDTVDDLRRKLTLLSSQVDNELAVVPYILDVSRPDV